MISDTLHNDQSPNRESFCAERGAALVECGICIALVAVVCIAATSGVGRSVSGLFQRASSELQIQGGGFDGIGSPGSGTSGGG